MIGFAIVFSRYGKWGKGGQMADDRW